MVPQRCDIYSAPLSPTEPHRRRSPRLADSARPSCLADSAPSVRQLNGPAEPSSPLRPSRLLADPAPPSLPTGPVPLSPATGPARSCGVVGHISPGYVPTDRSDLGQQSWVLPDPAYGGGEETKSTVLLRLLDDGYLGRWCHAYRT